METKLARKDKKSEKRLHYLQRKVTELEKANKDLSIMIKLCEEEKAQSKQLSDYESKIKEAKIKMIIENLEVDYK